MPPPAPRKPRRRWLKWLAAAILLVLVVVALRLTVFREEPVPVTVFLAARGRVEETVTNSKAGSIRARSRARLSPALGGRVVALPAAKGQRVSRGDLLLRLEDADLRARVLLAERALLAAGDAQRQACLESGLAQRDLDRAGKLFADGITTAERLDQAESRRDVTQAACEAAGSQESQARAQLQVARAELDKTVLRAPFDGVVADLATELGEWITPSPPGVPIPPVIDLIDPDSIYVSAPLDEVDIARVRLELPVRITLDAYPGRAFPGRLTRIAPYVLDIQGESRTFEVEALFDDAGFSRGLPPGLSADIEVILDAREDVLRVPAYALLEGHRVLLLEGDRLVRREVGVGLKNWEFAEITEGLEAGDAVVVSLDRTEVTEGALARQEAVAER